MALWEQGNALEKLKQAMRADTEFDASEDVDQLVLDLSAAVVAVDDAKERLHDALLSRKRRDLVKARQQLAKALRDLQEVSDGADKLIRTSGRMG